MKVLFCALLLSLPAFAQLRSITINYPAKAPANWPIFLAKEGGYYKKYGLDAKLVFAVHPAGIAMLVSGEAQMTNYPMDQAMQAAMRDGSLVIMGSPLNRALFAMMTRDERQERSRSERQTIRRQPTRRSALQLRAGYSWKVRDRSARCPVDPAGNGWKWTRRGSGERPDRCHHDPAACLFQARTAGLQRDRESRR